jgi:membrane protease YdiL (CAAX protease family)/tetratricopeptide (TPR) repeat protein
VAPDAANSPLPSAAGPTTPATEGRRRGALVAAVALAAAHLAALTGIRVAETKRDLARFGVSGPPRVVLAYSAVVAHSARGPKELVNEARSVETVCALAPGTPLAWAAAYHGALACAWAEEPAVAVRITEWETNQPRWPPGEATVQLSRAAAKLYRQLGRADDERRLAERAVAELPEARRSFFYQRLTAILSRAGDYDAALRNYKLAVRTSRNGVIYADALLGAAVARRALGDRAGAQRLRDASQKAPEVPSIELAFVVVPRLRAHITQGLARLERPGAMPRVHWEACLKADLDHVTRWVVLLAVMALLARLPVDRFANTSARQVLGATVLCMWPLLAYRIPRGGYWGDMTVVPLSDPRALLSWGDMILGHALLGVVVALTVFEGQRLADLGWRWSPAKGAQLALCVCLGVAWGGAESVAVYQYGAWSSVLGQLTLWKPGVACWGPLVAVYGALVEETLFRGYLLGALTRLTERFWLADSLQASLFVLLHAAGRSELPWGPTYASMLVFALAAGWAVRRTGALWAGVGFHLARNAAVWYVGATG